MKNLLLFTAIACTCLSSCSLFDDEDTKSQIIDLDAPIEFEQDIVKQACCVHFDLNKDGELSYKEAAEVTVIPPQFFEAVLEIQNLNDIKTFDELQYFTSLKVIEDRAFVDCTNLTSIIIPDNVYYIMNYAFAHCETLTNITIPNEVSFIGEGAFEGCKSLENITIPDSVGDIRAGAFAYCESLTNIIIPNDVYYIGYGMDGAEYFNIIYSCPLLDAFYGKFASNDNRCLIINERLNSFAPAGLTTYSIPNNVTEIDIFAFANCDALVSITIPESVTKIKRYAFMNCKTLTNIYCKATTPPILGTNVFKATANGRTIYVPRAAVNAYKTDEGWREYADNIVGYDFK